MADLRPVQSYINLDAIDAESDAMVAKVKSTVSAILSEFKKTKGIEIKLGGDPSSAKQIRQAIEDLTKTQQKLQKSIQDVNRIRTEQIKLELQQEKLATQRKKTLQEEVKLNDLNTKSKERLAAASAKEVANAIKSASAYDQLKQRYKIAANTAIELGASQGVLSEDFLEASKQANKLSKELYTLESSVGRNQRNVGNYASGWSGLSNSLNQITRELPSFANSVQTGFLAISNNLPIFFDEISRARKEITALRAEGKETQGLLSRLGSAFFSFGTILSIGVTLLTLYGKEIADFFVAMFKGQEVMNAFVEKQKLINEAFKDSAVKDAFENVERVGVAFNLARQGVISKTEALKVYNDSLGDTYGNATSLEEAERKYAANSENYIKATLFRAAAQKALAKATDAALAAIEAQNKKSSEFSSASDFFGSLSGFGGSTGLIDEKRVKEQEERVAKDREARRQAEIIAEQQKQKTFEQIAAELFTTAEDYAKKLPKLSIFDDDKAKKNNDKVKTINRQFFEDELKDRADALKKLSEEEDIFLRTREDARRAAAEIEKRLIKSRKDVELSNLAAIREAVLKDKESSAIDKLNAENEYNVAVKNLTQKSNYELIQLATMLQSDLFSIKLSSIARQRQLDKENADLAVQAFADNTPAKNLEKQNAAMKLTLEKRKDFLTADADDQLRRLEEKYQKEYVLVKNNPKKLAKLDEETSLKRKQIQNDANKFLLMAELDYATEYLSILKSLGFDVVDQEAKVAELRKKIKENDTKIMQDNSARQIAIEEDRAARLKELAKAGTDLIASAVEGTFDARKNQIQDEIDALDAKKQKEIEVANATIQNEQDRAAAIATINARAQAQKEQLEVRQRKVDQDRARFERLKAIVDVVQNTAIAISKEMARSGGASFPIIALISAIGAAQIAAIVSRPIPKYRMGTTDHPGGEAIVGDGGKREVVITPDGKMMVTPNTPTLMDLPKHTVVLPDADKATEMLAVMAMKSGIMQDRIDRGGDSGLKAEIIRLQRIIAEKEAPQTFWKNGELRTMIRKGQSFVEYLNRNV